MTRKISPSRGSKKGEEKGTRTLAAGWLLDGKGGPPLEDVLIEIHGGEFLSIHGGCTPGEMAAADADLTTCTILPGLCDCHVHLSLSGTRDAAARKKQLSSPFEEARETISDHIAAHLRHGIIAIRDGGDRQAHGLRHGRTRPPGGPPVQLFSPGQAWHARGRYGAMIGRTPLGHQTLAESILNLDHGDLIKILNSGANSLSEFGKETPPQFSLEELRDAASCGHSLGLKLMVHANGRLPVQWALDAGCDSIEHGYFMGRENLQRMADRGTPWIPTLYAMQALRDAGEGTREGETAARTLDHQLDLIRLSREYGVIVGLGTDAGSLGVNHGEALVEELRLFMSAGMSPGEVVRCAASTATDLLGIPGLGSIEPGRRAVFVVVQGGPEALPESLRAPAGVFIDGVRIIDH